MQGVFYYILAANEPSKAKLAYKIIIFATPPV